MEKEKLDLRLGIISDVHIGFIKRTKGYLYDIWDSSCQSKWFELVLNYYKNRGVDAIVIPGDLTNGWNYSINTFDKDCSTFDVEEFNKIYKKVFDGTSVKLVFCIGNHDLFYLNEKLNGGNQTILKDVFGMEYSHVLQFNVNGYDFICPGWEHEQESICLIKEKCKQNAGKPVFLLQHEAVKGTTCDSKYVSNNYIDIAHLENLSNLIVLTGNTHSFLTNDGTIWQSDNLESSCTILSCGTINYSSGVMGINGDNLKSKHGYYLTLKGNNVNVERLSFYTEESLLFVNNDNAQIDFNKCTASCGKDFNFVVGGKNVYGPKNRNKNPSKLEFVDNAFVSVEKGEKALKITFSSAKSLGVDDNIIIGYFVEVYDKETNEMVQRYMVPTEAHIDHNEERFSSTYSKVLDKLDVNGKYLFKIYARDCFENLSVTPLVKEYE